MPKPRKEKRKSQPTETETRVSCETEVGTRKLVMFQTDSVQYSVAILLGPSAWGAVRRVKSIGLFTAYSERGKTQREIFIYKDRNLKYDQLLLTFRLSLFMALSGAATI